MWTTEEREIIRECYRNIDEVFVQMRKGVAQTKYIIEVAPDAEYMCTKTYEYIPVPEHLIGFYMMKYPTDLNWADPVDAIKAYVWVKCKPVEVVTTVWEEVSL